MVLKSMLKRMFTHYGLAAANKASFRGCYEASVPKSNSVTFFTSE